MAQSMRIEPDVQFIRELQAAGGESLKKCYQCATCSVACPISPTDNPYPRKEMIWAQWGLKDRLLNDPDIWLCYNCGNCSDLCPRGAKPGDLMGALRNMAYQRLVAPFAIGKWMSSPKYLPILIAIPAALFAFYWVLMATLNFGGRFNGAFFPTREDGSIVFGDIFYGDYIIDPTFLVVLGFILFTFYKGVKNLINIIGPKGSVMVLGKQKPWYVCLVEVIFGEILPHSKFTECGPDKEKVSRKIGHMCLLFGFISLAVVTGCFAAGHWGGRIPGLEFLFLEAPLSFYNPLKILAQVGMILLLVGLTYLTVRRLGLQQDKQTSNYYDWYLLGVIWVVTLTGMFSQFFRLAQWVEPAFFVYYLHLVSVFMLFVYLPWSKLGHLVYRTAALTYVKYMGRP